MAKRTATRLRRVPSLHPGHRKGADAYLWRLEPALEIRKENDEWEPGDDPAEEYLALEPARYVITSRGGPSGKLTAMFAATKDGRVRSWDDLFPQEFLGHDDYVRRKTGYAVARAKAAASRKPKASSQEQQRSLRRYLREVFGV
jgi:hypothetical protein